MLLLASCSTDVTAVSPARSSPPTTAELDGKWKSEYGFYIVFNEQEGAFSASSVEDAADAGLGILGTFSLSDDELRLIENDDSESCPGVEGLYDARLTRDGQLRLTIIEDDCIYRVEGMFKGGKGGYRLLQFRRAK